MCSGKKEGCADRLSTGFGIGPSRSELQRTKDTTYPVGALEVLSSCCKFQNLGCTSRDLGADFKELQQFIIKLIL